VIEEDTISVGEALEGLQKALDEAYTAEDKLKQLLKQAGLIIQDKLKFVLRNQ